MTWDADVAVVGAGAAGLATARALARSGRDVVVFEQFALGHSRGSSHGTSRIFRLAYEDPTYVAMARAALPLWRELERESGTELIRTTGSLDVGANLEALQAALRENGVSAEILDRRELARRFPRLRLPEPEALFHAEGGFARADRTQAALLASARAHGADFREGTVVRAIEPADGVVVVTTAQGPVSVRSAVVTAGSWAPKLLAPLGIDLPVTVTRETVVHFRLADPDGLPTVIDRSLDPSTRREAYALPSPGIGLKAGVHRSGKRADPDTEGVPDEAVWRAAAEWVRERYELPDADPVLVETCLYTSTDDERFVFERHGRIVVCSACSGHGFKFTPEVGRRVAALAEEALAD